MNELLEEIYQMMADDLQEGVRKRVIRNRKFKLKLFCPKGMRAQGNKCVVMKSAEKIRRKRMTKKSAIKRKAKMSKILRKRRKSMKKRHTMGL